MGNYWAKFREVEGQLFRLDTRIYLNNINEPSNRDICIGAIVGKNPGSARPISNLKTFNYTEINLSGDKLLPNVLSIIKKSANKKIWKNEYIQVLNLFYLCNQDLNEAISAYKNVDNPIICESETNFFPWVWFVWGDSNFSLNDFKLRFTKIKSKKCFFYDKTAQKIAERIPSTNDFARHTQGFSHNLITPYFETVLNG